jgi:hypothetical protein
VCNFDNQQSPSKEIQEIGTENGQDWLYWQQQQQATAGNILYWSRRGYSLKMGKIASFYRIIVPLVIM